MFTFFCVYDHAHTQEQSENRMLTSVNTVLVVAERWCMSSRSMHVSSRICR